MGNRDAFEVFGIDALKSEQSLLIDAALAGRDVIGILPTGYGKSLCYQWPAAMGQGLTIVISPLLALMRDQVAALKRRGITATMISSQDDDDARFDKWCAAQDGSLRLLYMSPEQFAKSSTQYALRNCHLARIVVDEAHCFSSWGHDFRPDFRLIPQFVASGVALSAFSATASRRVVADIADNLFVNRAPLTVMRDAVRPNITMAFAYKSDPRAQLLGAFAKEGTVVIYAKTRSKCEVLAKAISAVEPRTDFYHAGLEADDRATREAAFFNGDIRVLVATNAFGLGVDKADIRQVIHADMPPSIEAYVQEIGRAGRDGAPAQALCFFDDDDHEWRAEQIQKSVQDDALRAGDIARLYAMRALCDQTAPTDTIRAYFDDAATDNGATDAPDDAHLKLLRWRGAKAQQRKFAPYMILPDKLVERIAAVNPASIDALASIDGMGKSRLRQYGDEILAVLGHDTCTSTRRQALALSGRGGLVEVLRDLERDLYYGSNGDEKPLALGNTLIMRVSQMRPQSHAALEQIRGMDEKRLARYGDAIMMAIRRIHDV